MIKTWLKSFVHTLGRICAFIVMILMAIAGIIFMLNKSDKYKKKQKQLKLYVKNPQAASDKKKGEQLEKDIDDLLCE